jgi:hypothetical protein
LTPIVVTREGASCEGKLRFLAQPDAARAKTISAAAVVCRRVIGNP